MNGIIKLFIGSLSNKFPSATKVSGQRFERVDADECLLGSSCSFTRPCRACDYYRPAKDKWQERLKNGSAN